MKSLFLRSGLVLACALTLASCGGGSGNLLLGGAVAGLTADGLVLQNNGGDDLTVAANQTTFAFKTLIGSDSDYNVTVKSSPASAVCTPSSNKGKSASFDVTTVLITCITNTYDLGGTVSGLKGTGLVLINGSDRVTVNPGDTTVKFAKVADGSAYGVTVLSQPSGQTCTVANGTAKMGSAAVNNIQVSCV